MKLRYNLIGNLYEQYRDLGISHNALLRGEQRNTDATAYPLKH